MSIILQQSAELFIIVQFNLGNEFVDPSVLLRKWQHSDMEGMRLLTNFLMIGLSIISGVDSDGCGISSTIGSELLSICQAIKQSMHWHAYNYEYVM